MALALVLGCAGLGTLGLAAGGAGLTAWRLDRAADHRLGSAGRVARPVESETQGPAPELAGPTGPAEPPPAPTEPDPPGPSIPQGPAPVPVAPGPAPPSTLPPRPPPAVPSEEPGQPDPEPSSTPSRPSAPEPPSLASVTVQGGVTVLLRSAAGESVQPGEEVRPGTYAVLAAFPGNAQPTQALTGLTLAAGDRVVRFCNASFRGCEVRR